MEVNGCPDEPNGLPLVNAPSLVVNAPALAPCEVPPVLRGRPPARDECPPEVNAAALLFEANAG